MFEFVHCTQINCGQRAGAEDKGALKEWYIQNASFWLDIRIILRTGCGEK
jgi:lipopolysaccharide/colanic/teichoic acid biosynthesis glycosyltransferase